VDLTVTKIILQKLYRPAFPPLVPLPAINPQTVSVSIDDDESKCKSKRRLTKTRDNYFVNRKNTEGIN
jgi:hypothetical protein